MALLAAGSAQTGVGTGLCHLYPCFWRSPASRCLKVVIPTSRFAVKIISESDKPLHGLVPISSFHLYLWQQHSPRHTAGAQPGVAVAATVGYTFHSIRDQPGPYGWISGMPGMADTLEGFSDRLRGKPQKFPRCFRSLALGNHSAPRGIFPHLSPSALESLLSVIPPLGQGCGRQVQ